MHGLLRVTLVFQDRKCAPLHGRLAAGIQLRHKCPVIVIFYCHDKYRQHMFSPFGFFLDGTTRTAAGAIGFGTYTPINAPPPYFVTAFYKKFSQQIEAPAIK